MTSKDFVTVHNHIENIIPLTEVEPTERLPYPSLSSAYEGGYAAAMCVWDHHHMSMRLACGKRPQYLKYLVDNVLSYQSGDGYVPNVVHFSDGPIGMSPSFHAQPFLMQAALMYVDQTGDLAWAEKQYEPLESYLGYYETACRSPRGLFRWPMVNQGGFDNDVVSFFQPDTVVSCDLSSWLTLEYKAAANLAARLKRPRKQADYAKTATVLADQIEDVLWCDEVDSYAAYNLCTASHLFSFREEGLDKSVGKYTYQTSSNLIPLYARIPGPDRAKVMIERYVLSEDHFLSPFGIRSLSRSSEFYNHAIWGNPPRFGYHGRPTNSNWQGPVWIPLCYFMFHALRNYGYISEAADLINRTLRVLAMSVEKMGSFFENYHAETGQPLYAKGFASWNILADVMHDELRENRWIMDCVFES